VAFGLSYYASLRRRHQRKRMNVHGQAQRRRTAEVLGANQGYTRDARVVWDQGTTSRVGVLAGTMTKQTMHGPLHDLLTADHARLEALLSRATKDPAHFDHEAFEEFRSGLLRHIAIEEKILLPDARRRRNGESLPLSERLRIDHGAGEAHGCPPRLPSLDGEVERFLASALPGPAILEPTLDACSGQRGAGPAVGGGSPPSTLTIAARRIGRCASRSASRFWMRSAPA
jgi:hypothetical protein